MTLNNTDYIVDTYDVLDMNLVITVPADILVPNAARPSVGTPLTTKLDMITYFVDY